MKPNKNFGQFIENNNNSKYHDISRTFFIQKYKMKIISFEILRHDFKVYKQHVQTSNYKSLVSMFIKVKLIC